MDDNLITTDYGIKKALLLQEKQLMISRRGSLNTSLSRQNTKPDLLTDSQMSQEETQHYGGSKKKLCKKGKKIY